jgi:sigma-B regulation protein RsbQ
VSVVERNNVRLLGPETAPALVFSHGFGCDQNMWRFVAPRFADDHRVVLFDHVGAGNSDLAAYNPQRYSTLSGYAEDLLASIAEPDRFSKLVLVGPSPRYIDDEGYYGGFSANEIDELLDSLDSNYLGWSAAMAPVIMGNAERPELGEELTNSFCRTDPAIARQFAEVTFRSDNRADLGKVTVPTLILQCSEDVIAPREVGAYTNANIPGSRLLVLDATGHCPNLSAPDETHAAISAFLRTG